MPNLFKVGTLTNGIENLLGVQGEFTVSQCEDGSIEVSTRKVILRAENFPRLVQIIAGFAPDDDMLRALRSSL